MPWWRKTGNGSGVSERQKNGYKEIFLLTFSVFIFIMLEILVGLIYEHDVLI